MAKTIDKISEFEKQFSEYKAYGIRLNSVTGSVSAEEEEILSEKYPQLAFNKTGEETITFNLSNGKNIIL